MYLNLAVHSYYSLLMSSISIDDIINHALKHKQKHVVLIDINAMYGAIEFYHKAVNNKLIPIIGLQITYQQEKVILVAKNNDGYKALLKISSHTMCNESYDINAYTEDLYIIVNNKNNCPWLKAQKDVYSAISQANDPIAVQECFFENKADIKYLQALLAIKSDQQLDSFLNNHEFDHNYMLTETEAKKKFSSVALKNLEHVIASCEWVLPKNVELNFVKYDPKVSSKILLQTKCKEGLKERLNSSSAPEAYITRLKKELDVIDHMHFNDYFLVVHDYVNFAKRNGILVGPGRGSAAGSLVAYVLGITEIDPITHDLIFERFLNPMRVTMPDIDIDFMDNRRNEIIEYVFERYGKDHVAHIITFQRLKAKMAIRDAGRILGIDLPIINNISKLIGFEYESDLKGAIKENSQIKSFATKYEELFDIASKILNFPRQIGLHAAGIVMTNTTMSDYLPVQSSADGINVTQYSMEYLEPLGLIKMDILGLTNLTTISETIKLIEKNKSVKINLSTIDLNDKKVFQQLANGDTIGIFQLESPGMRNLIMRIKPTSIEDISITSALFRPGPQKNIPTYLENKHHPENINYLNNDFKTVLTPTYNIIIYQEQIIELVQRVANFSLGDADLFRRAVSKKDADKLASLKETFIAGGLKNHYSQSELEKIFDFIYEFANYGFNHSHSLAYSYISYWMAYLKTHYPLEYFTILLASSENSIDKIALYVQSARSRNIAILPPSINESSFSFNIKNKAIIFGFNAIKGIGSETINKILQAKNNKVFKDYIEAIGILANHNIGIKVIETLIKAGCFDKLLNDKTRYYLLVNLEEIYAKASTMTSGGKLLISPVLQEVTTTSHINEELQNEQLRLIGISFVEHPLIKVKASYNGEYQIVNLMDADEEMGQISHCLVRLNSFRVIKTKTNKSMAFATVEDDTKVASVVIFPGVYEKHKTILIKDNIFVMTVKADPKGLQALSLKEYHNE